MPTQQNNAVAGQRKVLIFWAVPAVIITVAIWLCIYYLLPPLTGMEELSARMIFALGCSSIATLLCFVLGIEAVSHERLQSRGIDPLTGYETKRMRINLRYLQNTLEQLFVFIPGLFLLAYYSPSDSSMKAVIAVTIVWIIARFGFWIGYHYNSISRVAGIAGVAQSLVVLLYVCGRFSYDVAGGAGAVVVLGVFLGVEVYLFYITGQPSPKL